MPAETTRPLIYPVILSGGSGTRLWPMSRSAYPKQLLPLLSELSLLQDSVKDRNILKSFMVGAFILKDEKVACE